MAQQVDRLEEAVLILPSVSADRRSERRDAAENRQRVLDTARRLFDEYGVEAVSMHQIAQAAGVGQGTLYRRYPHKGELCRDLLSETFDTFRAETDECLAASAAASPLVRLNGFLARFLDLMDTKTALLAAIGDACWGQRRVEKFQSPGYQWAHGTIAALLTEAVAAGEIHPIEPSFTADALLAALSPDVYEFQREVRGKSKDEILEGIRRIFS